MTIQTPFQADIIGQPDALRDLAAAELPAGLLTLAERPWSRIVLTGMGSSHFAGIPSWRALVAAGLPAWSVDAGQLLDSPELITAETLLVVTSQSGASGEVVELLARQRGAGRATVVGIAADADSPLAREADVFLPLHSGPEATVSTKSYLNTLVVHAQLVATLTGGDPAAVAAQAGRIAEVVASVIAETHPVDIATSTLEVPRPRVAAVGWADDAATALFAGLITKESSKVPVEGHVGGQFRHGPFELAGPGLTVFIYGAHAASAAAPWRRLAADVIGTGSRVVLVGSAEVAGAVTLRAPASTPLEGLITASVVAQLVAVEFARANGVVPGAFAYGSKVTTTL